MRVFGVPTDELPFAERDLLYFAAYMARAELLLESNIESCMVTSRLVSEIYRGMGIVCIPVVVGATAMNAAAWVNAVRDEKVVLHAGPESEAFAIQIKHDPERHSDAALQGHLTIVAANRYFVDASIDQLSRPTRKLTIAPMIADFEDAEVSFADFLGGESMVTPLPEGGQIIYEPHADDLFYTTFPDWEPVEDDPRLVKARDAVMGLVQVVLDTGQFPELPSLPTSASSTAMKVAAALNDYGLTAEEATETFMRHGFTIEEYVDSLEAVSQRVGIEPPAKVIPPR